MAAALRPAATGVPIDMRSSVKAAAGGRAEHVDDDGQDRERARTLNHRNDNVTGVLF